MTTYYSISPYEGELTDDLSIYWARQRSTFQIHPGDYRRLLKDYWGKKWPKMWIRGPSEVVLLVWEMYIDPDYIASGHGYLEHDHRTVSTDVFLAEFILWQRKIIPPGHKAVLYADTSAKFLELTYDTTREEIEAWRQTIFD